MEVVDLNVGARIFATTRSTLCKHSGSMLAAMFSGDMQLGQQDNQGRFFIDRDGDRFATILSYLRGEPTDLPRARIQRQALAADARYFQELEELLHAEPSKQSSAAQHELLLFDGQTGVGLLEPRTTYDDKLAMLYSGAVRHTGVYKVREMCEAMSKAYFLYHKPDWYDTKWAEAIESLLDNPAVEIIDAAHPCVKGREDELRAPLAFAAQLVSLAGSNADEFSKLMLKYLPIFQCGMKQRGFQLRFVLTKHMANLSGGTAVTLRVPIRGWELKRLSV